MKENVFFKKSLVYGLIVILLNVGVIPLIIATEIPGFNIYNSDIVIAVTNPNNGSLSGYVKDTYMNPIPEARVRVSFHETYEENYTDSSGYYRVTNIRICWCLKNCTAYKEGYSTEEVWLSINENTIYDFILTCISLQVDANGPYYGIINEPIHFYGSTSCGSEPYTWHWDFGDSYSSDERYPEHTYTNPGIYTVVLTVKDDENNIVSNSTFAKIQESNNPPSPPNITGPTSGKVGMKYDFNFVSIDPEGNDIWYYVQWDDNSNRKWDGPYSSGTEITRTYRWMKRGAHTIKAKAMDWYADEGKTSEFEIKITIPRTRESYCKSLFMRFIDMFPIIQRLFNFII